MNNRYEIPKLKNEVRKLENRCKKLGEIAKRANSIVAEEKDKLGLICFVAKKELDKILATAKKMRKDKDRSTETRNNTEIIIETGEKLRDRVHKVHN